MKEDFAEANSELRRNSIPADDPFCFHSVLSGADVRGVNDIAGGDRLRREKPSRGRGRR